MGRYLCNQNKAPEVCCTFVHVVGTNRSFSVLRKTHPMNFYSHQYFRLDPVNKAVVGTDGGFDVLCNGHSPEVGYVINFGDLIVAIPLDHCK